MIKRDISKVDTRLTLLLDKDSFIPALNERETEIIGGTGTIDGKLVTIIAINPEATVQLDPVLTLKKEIYLIDLAANLKTPLIHLADRPFRVAKDTTAIPVGVLQTFINPDGAGRVFSRFAALSGVVPRIAIVFSQIATTLTYPVAECDTAVMIEGSGMSLGRPDMVKLMTGDKCSYEEYGGAEMHAEISGLCDMLAKTEEDALLWTRKYLSFFPSYYTDKPPLLHNCSNKIEKSHSEVFIPKDPYSGFDIRELLEDFTDPGSLLFHRSLFAKELITAFARVNGYPFGIIANNSACQGGILFHGSCRKLASFATLCDSFNIPLLFLADLPGFMVGRESEQAGIIQYGALVLSTIAQLSTPHLCVVVRKAYTAGLYAMGGTGFDPYRLIALKGAELTIYGEKAIRKLARQGNFSPEKEEELVEKVKEKSNLSNYRKDGFLDRIIDPHELREEISDFLLKTEQKSLIRDSPRRILCI